MAAKFCTFKCVLVYLCVYLMFLLADIPKFPMGRCILCGPGAFMMM
uniref:Uncharacterized protein n=1 Tax=Anguilla anguilla TaxID=7936 RepID=A0A0E9XLP0_ANGAN